MGLAVLALLPCVPRLPGPGSLLAILVPYLLVALLVVVVFVGTWWYVRRRRRAVEV